MSRRVVRSLFGVLWCLGLLNSVRAQVVEKYLSDWRGPVFRAWEKKLVGFAWGMPSPLYLRDHIAELEAETPYLDGLVFKLPETKMGEWPPWLPAFDNRRWTEEDVPLATLRQIRWGRFKHNFIALGPGPTYDESGVNWFDDAAWKIVVENLKLLSLSVKVSGARGVFFDVENYSGLWHYWHKVSLAENPPTRICHYPGFSFAQVEAKVRQRGQEFITALQAHKPDVVVFATALLSGSGDDPAKVETSYYPLLRAFTSGMLDASGTKVVLVDGCEGTYWTNGSDGYLWWHNALKENSSKIAPDNTRLKWQRQSTTGMAVFYDALVDGLYTDKLPVVQAYRLKWLEHNTYHALLSNDEWTWLYLEKASPWTGDGLLPVAKEAIERAKTKALGNQPLGWTMVWQSLDQPVPSKLFDTPDFRITSPKANAVFTGGQSITIEVTPGDGVALTSVQFYLDSRPLLSVANPPFRAVLKNVPPGAHTLLAVGNFSGDRDRGQAAPVVFEVRR